MSRRDLIGILFLAASLIAGCRSGAHSRQWPPLIDPNEPLYNRLGGSAAIRALVDDATDLLLNDPRVNLTRAGTPAHWPATPHNIEAFKGHFTDFLVQITGGPEEYRGRGMAEAHRGMRITDAEFLAFLFNMRAAMARRRIPGPTGRDLIELLEDYRPAIVGAGSLGRGPPGEHEQAAAR